MLFQSICIKALASLAIPTFVLGSATPNVNEHDLAELDTNVTIISGEPALLILDAISTRDVTPEEDEDYSSQLLPRGLSKDDTEALRIHNAARKEKKLKPLVWDSKLQKDALNWAREMARTGFRHSGAKGQGENIGAVLGAKSVSSPNSLHSRAWVAEKKNYHGEAIGQGNFMAYGHYTQVMWKSTTKVGIATVKDGKGNWYTAARYWPQGNWSGQKPY